MSDSTNVLHLYDTLSGQLQPVLPGDGRVFRFYCCGPTVYGPAHIGNFRTFLIQDVFRRVMALCGHEVLHVRNITDVDDKTIHQSQAEGKSLAAFTGYWLDRFHADCAALNLLPPDVEPSAVEHIPDIIAMIARLVERDLAYRAADGSVYYRIEKFPGYGRLSRLQEREITTSDTAQDRDEYDDGTAADFALWKARKPEDGPNFWESPWGPGRPGWHIECSAMSTKYLGATFDLHAGGIDLIFPHHENEIAQSEGATGQPFARHWFHSAHLMVQGGKMSKRLGNLYTLADIEEQGFAPMDLRYALIAGHYRKPLNYTRDSLHAARQANRKLAEFRSRLEGLLPEGSRPSFESLCKEHGVSVRFESAWRALLDQLNVPRALGELFREMHEAEKGGLTAETAPAFACGFWRMMDACGLDPEEERATEIPEDIRNLAEQRWTARIAKEWARSDELRDALSARGWSVKDSRDGYELEQI